MKRKVRMCICAQRTLPLLLFILLSVFRVSLILSPLYLLPEDMCGVILCKFREPIFIAKGQCTTCCTQTLRTLHPHVLSGCSFIPHLTHMMSISGLDCTQLSSLSPPGRDLLQGVVVAQYQVRSFIHCF